MQVRRTAERHRQIGFRGVVQQWLRELLEFSEARIPQLLPFRVTRTFRLSAFTFRTEYFSLFCKKKKCFIAAGSFVLIFKITTKRHQVSSDIGRENPKPLRITVVFFNIHANMFVVHFLTVTKSCRCVRIMSSAMQQISKSRNFDFPSVLSHRSCNLSLYSNWLIRKCVIVLIFISWHYVLPSLYFQFYLIFPAVTDLTLGFRRKIKDLKYFTDRGTKTNFLPIGLSLTNLKAKKN